MASKRKYRPGDVITSLDDLAAQELIYMHHKIYHKGWWSSLQFRVVEAKLIGGYIRKAERIKEDGNT